MRHRRPLLLACLALVAVAGLAAGIGRASAAAPVCAPDAVGDQRARLNPDGDLAETTTAVAAGDLTRVCAAETDGGLVVTVGTAEAPAADDPSLADRETAVVVGLDAGSDGSAERFVVIGSTPPESSTAAESSTAGAAPESSAVRATVADRSGAARCTAAVTLTAEGYEVAALGADCTGPGPFAVQASSRYVVDPMTYDDAPDQPLRPVLVDLAPNGGGFVGPEGAVGPLPGASRLAGPGRIQTAIQISRSAFPATARTVYLARADVLVDAVASGSLTDGPVLLVPTCGDVPAEVADEVERLDPQRVVALGGMRAICEATLADAAAGRTAERIAGDDRVGTAAEVAAAAFPVGASEVYLARADALADAVPAGTLDQGPLLLVPGCGDVPLEVRRAVERLVPERVVVLGGADAVCDELADELAGARPVVRLAGDGRLDTAVEIAERGFPGGAPTVYLARADIFPDSVAGGALAGGPILLTPVCGELPVTVADALAALNPDRVVALGGTAAVCDATLEAAGEAAAR